MLSITYKESNNSPIYSVLVHQSKLLGHPIVIGKYARKIEEKNKQIIIIANNATSDYSWDMQSKLNALASKDDKIRKAIINNGTHLPKILEFGDILYNCKGKDPFIYDVESLCVAIKSLKGKECHICAKTKKLLKKRKTKDPVDVETLLIGTDFHSDYDCQIYFSFATDHLTEVSNSTISNFKEQGLLVVSKLSSGFDHPHIRIFTNTKSALFRSQKGYTLSHGPIVRSDVAYVVQKHMSGLCILSHRAAVRGKVAEYPIKFLFKFQTYTTIIEWCKKNGRIDVIIFLAYSGMLILNQCGDIDVGKLLVKDRYYPRYEIFQRIIVEGKYRNDELFNVTLNSLEKYGQFVYFDFVHDASGGELNRMNLNMMVPLINTSQHVIDGAYHGKLLSKSDTTMRPALIKSIKKLVNQVGYEKFKGEKGIIKLQWSDEMILTYRKKNFSEYKVENLDLNYEHEFDSEEVLSVKTALDSWVVLQNTYLDCFPKLSIVNNKSAFIISALCDMNISSEGNHLFPFWCGLLGMMKKTKKGFKCNYSDDEIAKVLEVAIGFSGQYNNPAVQLLVNFLGFFFRRGVLIRTSWYKRDLLINWVGMFSVMYRGRQCMFDDVIPLILLYPKEISIAMNFHFILSTMQLTVKAITINSPSIRAWSAVCALVQICCKHIDNVRIMIPDYEPRTRVTVMESVKFRQKLKDLFLSAKLYPGVLCNHYFNCLSMYLHTFNIKHEVKEQHVKQKQKPKPKLKPKNQLSHKVKKKQNEKVYVEPEEDEDVQKTFADYVTTKDVFNFDEKIASFGGGHVSLTSEEFEKEEMGETYELPKFTPNVHTTKAPLVKQLGSNVWNDKECEWEHVGWNENDKKSGGDRFENKKQHVSVSDYMVPLGKKYGDYQDMKSKKKYVPRKKQYPPHRDNRGRNQNYRNNNNNYRNNSKKSKNKFNSVKNVNRKSVKSFENSSSLIEELPNKKQSYQNSQAQEMNYIPKPRVKQPFERKKNFSNNSKRNRWKNKINKMKNRSNNVHNGGGRGSMNRGSSKQNNFVKKSYETFDPTAGQEFNRKY